LLLCIAVGIWIVVVRTLNPGGNQSAAVAISPAAPVAAATAGHAPTTNVSSVVTDVTERELGAASTVPNSTQSSISAPSMPATSTKPTPAATKAGSNRPTALVVTDVTERELRPSPPTTNREARTISTKSADAKTEGSGRDKTTNNETAADGEKAALIKAMKDAVAARHGGVLPKSMTAEDAEIAAQAAIKWKKRQANEKAKQELAALKVKPPPASGDAEIYLAQEAIRKVMREPSSAVFEDVFFVDDRKSETGYYVPVVCGTVNGRDEFGGMTGPRHFVALMDKQAQGLWLEGSTPQNLLASEWNRFCAGSHNETIASAIRQASGSQPQQRVPSAE
jgi:hypothetical protein